MRHNDSVAPPLPTQPASSCRGGRLCFLPAEGSLPAFRAMLVRTPPLDGFLRAL